MGMYNLMVPSTKIIKTETRKSSFYNQLTQLPPFKQPAGQIATIK